MYITHIHQTARINPYRQALLADVKSSVKPDRQRPRRQCCSLYEPVEKGDIHLFGPILAALLMPEKKNVPFLTFSALFQQACVGDPVLVVVATH